MITLANRDTAFKALDGISATGYYEIVEIELSEE